MARSRKDLRITARIGRMTGPIYCRLSIWRISRGLEPLPLPKCPWNRTGKQGRGVVAKLAKLPKSPPGGRVTSANSAISAGVPRHVGSKAHWKIGQMMAMSCRGFANSPWSARVWRFLATPGAFGARRGRRSRVAERCGWKEKFLGGGNSGLRHARREPRAPESRRRLCPASCE